MIAPDATSCPGRGAAFFMPLRRAGTVPNTGVRYGPGSQRTAIREELRAALRGHGHQAALRRVSGITSQIMARPVAATAASPKNATLLPSLSLT